MVLLLARTQYSLLTAPASPQRLCEEAVLRGHDHLALADTNGLYGLMPFVQQATRLGLHAVCGAELAHAGRRCVLLARDRAGYASLCALLSALHLDADFDLMRAVAAHAEGLFVLCGDLALLPALAARLHRAQLRVLLPPRGLPAPPPPAPPVDAGRKLPDPGPRWPRHELLDAAAALDLPLVAAADVWFPRAEDFALHQLFLAVKWNRSLRGGEAVLRGLGVADASMHLPARGDADRGFDDAPAAVANAEALLAACTLTFADKPPPIFPPYAVPAGTTAAAHLRGLAAAGLRRRYAAPDAALAARLHGELQVIEQMGFPPYFLAVHDIAELARARAIPFVGRGSAADSLVAYCLGLTDADPIRYGLLFERFLNSSRHDLPDIDLDFCWRRRDELIAAVYDHFGRDHVAMIATYNTCGPRAAYAEAAKAAGVPPDEAARRSKLLPWHRRSDLDLAAEVAATPGFYRQPVLPTEQERHVVAAAQQLLQVPRHLGVHPGGVVITPGPMRRHAPLERAAKGVVVTQYDMHFVEALGLVKIDLLGNRALSIVNDCLGSLRSHGIAVPDLQQIAEDDAATAALLRSGRTLACFQVESPAMRTLLRQLQAGTMDRVIQAVALVRPGPAAAGMKDAFVRRARGLEPVTAAHPLLLEVFADTFGIMLYQEDVIRAAMAVAGLDGAAGDALRRRFGKLDADAGFDAFVVAGLHRGLPRPALAQVWAEMARFGAYSFCKAHAVTYGRIAYRCVWLKARWPAAFLAAMLRNDAGYYDKGVYVEEAKRLGATFLPPCVNLADAEFALAAPDAIRTGLQEVRGLSQHTLDTLLRARAAGGPFRSLDDFLQRVRPARDEAENLILCGGFDGLQRTRPELLWRLQVALSSKTQRERTAAAAPGALFAEALAPRDISFPDLPEHGPAMRTRCELEVLGFALGAHPVDVLWQQPPAAAKHCVPCGKLEERIGQHVAAFGWAVAYRRHRGESGESMLFVTLEDGTGIVEVVLFPRAFQSFGGELQGRGPFVVSGVVEERMGGVALRASGVKAVVEA